MKKTEETHHEEHQQAFGHPGRRGDHGRLRGVGHVRSMTPAASGTAAGGPAVDTAGIDQVLRQAVGPSKVAGLVATAATDKGTFYEAAYGKRSLDTGVDMTPDSVFWIASMTKADNLRPPRCRWWSRAG